MRGEHYRTLASSQDAAGSSPHARGARRELYTAPFIWGIIPACAGSTTIKECKDAEHEDHPRMRGEHRLGRDPAEVEPGIIPACAGSTRHLAFSLPVPGDHPRMRGEHSAGLALGAWVGGSSPHARGAL